MSFIKALMLVVSVMLLGCGDDLSPSGSTNGVTAPPATVQFSALDSQGDTVTLPELLNGYDAVLLYFTMWCPVCDSHQQALRQQLQLAYPQLNIVLVDYVSGDVTAARAEQLSAGMAAFVTLVDDGRLQQQFNADMASVVLIDSAQQLRYQDVYNSASLLQAEVKRVLR